MKNRYLKILLFSVISLGFFLRIIFLNIAPPALNIDEAALGYNAYSILKTGKDEHGVFLPLSLQSFGDWKLPLYSYVATIPVWLLGLNELSTRLPSIIAGTLGILCIYLIGMKLYKNRAASLLSSFFFAVSPWSIYFSRAAYEVNLATTIFLSGFTFFLYGLSSKNKKLLLSVSGILFGLTLFTYHSFIIFMPMFTVSLLFLYRKQVNNRSTVFFLLPFIALVVFSIFSNLAHGSTKAVNTSILNNKDILYGRVENFRKDTTNSDVAIFDVIYTKYLGIPYHFFQNYLSSFSPVFLFDKGGEKLVHNVDGIGNLYALDAVILLVGLFGLFYFRERSIKIIGVWLLLSPIASSITIDSPNSTRMFMIMPVFMLVLGYGAYLIFYYFRRTFLGRLLILGIILIYILNVYFFLNLYFVHNEFHRAQFWRYGLKEIVQITNSNSEKNIVMRGPENFPYIYFLFYNSYNPESFRKTVQYYPPTSEGFVFVKSFDRYKFVPLLQDEIEKNNVLYIDDQNFNQEDSVVSLPNGDPIFKYYMKHD